MKLWQKDFNVHQQIDQFTVGQDRELDLQLAKYDIQGSLAHIQMLTKIGLLEQHEWVALAKSLKVKLQFGIEDLGSGPLGNGTRVHYSLPLIDHHV